MTAFEFAKWQKIPDAKRFAAEHLRGIGLGDEINPDLLDDYERMHERELIFTNFCQYPRTKKDIDLFVKAVKKVLE